MRRAVTVHLSARSVLIAIGFLLLIWAADHAVNVIFIIVLATLLTASMAPMVRGFEKRFGWHRLGAVLAVFGVIIVVVAVVGLALAPSLVTQSQALATNWPDYADKLKGSYSWLQGYGSQYSWMPNLQNVAKSVSASASAYLSSTLGLAGRVVGSAFELFVVLIVTFFMLLEGPELQRGILLAVPPEQRDRWAAQFEPIGMKLAGYVRGMLISMGALAVLLAIGLEVAGVPLALALAVLSGLLAVIPLVGGYLGILPAVLIALTISWQKAVAVLVVYWAANSIVGHFVMPIVFAKGVDVSPLVIMLALLLGAELGGVAGALIAVPFMAAVQVLVQNLYLQPREQLFHALSSSRVKDGLPQEVRLRYDESGA